MLQMTVQNGAKLLPDVPKGTGGNKSKYIKLLKPKLCTKFEFASFNGCKKISNGSHFLGR